MQAADRRENARLTHLDPMTFAVEDGKAGELRR